MLCLHSTVTLSLTHLMPFLSFCSSKKGSEFRLCIQSVCQNTSLESSGLEVILAVPLLVAPTGGVRSQWTQSVETFTSAFTEIPHVYFYGMYASDANSVVSGQFLQIQKEGDLVSSTFSGCLPYTNEKHAACFMFVHNMGPSFLMILK